MRNTKTKSRNRKPISPYSRKKAIALVSVTLRLNVEELCVLNGACKAHVPWITNICMGKQNSMPVFKHTASRINRAFERAKKKLLDALNKHREAA